MESDHSLSVLILILFLFSRKLVCANFKCHQVSVTHFLSLMYCKTFWHLFHSLLHGVFQILFWPRYSFVPLGFITLGWRVCLWVRASSVCGSFTLPVQPGWVLFQIPSTLDLQHLFPPGFQNHVFSSLGVSFGIFTLSTLSFIFLRRKCAFVIIYTYAEFTVFFFFICFFVRIAFSHLDCDRCFKVHSMYLFPFTLWYKL